jgi:hypothetical protein
VKLRASILHRTISLAVAIAVPVVATAINDGFDVEFIVLGAIIGFAYWYWGPAWPPL